MQVKLLHVVLPGTRSWLPVTPMSCDNPACLKEFNTTCVLECVQDDLMAEQMQQAADRAQKWKGRCAKLRQDLLHNQTTAASLQAALNVSCKHLQNVVLSCLSVTADVLIFHCKHLLSLLSGAHYWGCI